MKDEAAAKRLARAILSDVLLYNGPKLSAGADPRVVLAADLQEGRTLFRERTAPDLHPIFERELAAFDFTAATRSGSRSRLMLVLIGIVLVLIAAGVAVMSR